jgi:hypothetical protein
VVAEVIVIQQIVVVAVAFVIRHACQQHVIVIQDVWQYVNAVHVVFLDNNNNPHFVHFKFFLRNLIQAKTLYKRLRRHGKIVL